MLNSKIQWTDATHNFWSGCHKVSEGCKYCYMHRILEGKDINSNIVIRADKSYFNRPLSWKEPRKIFTCSMSDFFIEEADGWRNDAWEVIRQTPQHSWLILTKRDDRILECLPEDWGKGYTNVALGVTVENQKRIYRMETLATIPAALRFVSAEPLLESINFLITDAHGNRPIDAIHQVLIGGESGNETGKYRYRPCELTWMRTMVGDLKNNTTTKVFVKQMGTYLKNQIGLKDQHGGDINEFPKDLQIREIMTRKQMYTNGYLETVQLTENVQEA